MLLADAGFFLFTYYLFFRTDPATAQVAGSLNFWVFIVIYALILATQGFGYCVLAGRGWFNSFLRTDADNGLFFMGR